jgi:hypothetical protein
VKSGRSPSPCSRGRNAANRNIEWIDAKRWEDLELRGKRERQCVFRAPDAETPYGIRGGLLAARGEGSVARQAARVSRERGSEGAWGSLTTSAPGSAR